jgi:bifunctional enzyme CysN/CysC
MSRSGELLRLATAGSVDDGKSTLIGRLLYDAKALMADEVARAEVDLAHLIDGLRAEREQGITIDVAYRFFATPQRSFIIADTPGHVRYTRNMVTGASTADAALVLVDARNGILEQSRRHASIASLLGIRHLIACVNKMDLVGWDEGRFREIESAFVAMAQRLGIEDARAIPLSALVGDNVVDASVRTPWYSGPPLLTQLEQLEVAEDRNLSDVRFPVQLTIRDTDYRGYAGRVAGGVLRVGDEVVVLPAGERPALARIDTPSGPVESVEPPLAATVLLTDELDVGRGDMIARASEAPVASRELAATLCWLGDAPARAGGSYLLKHTTRMVRAKLDAIEDRLDVTTLDRAPAGELELNAIGRVRLRLGGELAADPYAVSRATGAFILIDEATNDTVGAGMIDG